MIELPITSFHIYPGWGIKDKSGRHYQYQTTSKPPDWESILWVQFKTWENSLELLVRSVLETPKL